MKTIVEIAQEGVAAAKRGRRIGLGRAAHPLPCRARSPCD
jgi:hypothetical protein